MHETLRIRLSAGLALEGVRYSGGEKTPAICLPGLTRNARDFETVGPFIAGAGRDAIALSLRGRGGSDRAEDHLTYHPATYRDDILEAMTLLGVARAVFVGTSLGGITTMLIAAAAPQRVAGAIINDVGPALAPEGIARIIGYAGQTRADAASLDEAANQIRAINEVAFPGRDAGFWRSFARRTYRENNNGSWSLDYDQRIGKALTEAPPAPDLWPAFASLKGAPTLVIRGAISDLLSPEIVAEMRTVHPSFEYCEVPRVGHAPMLDEPDAVAAIGAFLNKID